MSPIRVLAGAWLLLLIAVSCRKTAEDAGTSTCDQIGSRAKAAVESALNDMGRRRNNAPLKPDDQAKIIALKQELTLGVQLECEAGVWSTSRLACYRRASTAEDFVRCRIRTDDELR
jgi:hypothetical protein